MLKTESEEKEMLGILAGAVASTLILGSLSSDKIDKNISNHIRFEDIRNKFKKHKKNDLLDKNNYKVTTTFLQDHKIMFQVVFEADETSFGNISKFVIEQNDKNQKIIEKIVEDNDFDVLWERIAEDGFIKSTIIHFDYSNEYDLCFSKEQRQLANEMIVEQIFNNTIEINAIDAETLKNKNKKELSYLDNFFAKAAEVGILIKKEENKND